jgi:hypothetical protein
MPIGLSCHIKFDRRARLGEIDFAIMLRCRERELTGERQGIEESFALASVGASAPGTTGQSVRSQSRNNGVQPCPTCCAEQDSSRLSC